MSIVTLLKIFQYYHNKHHQAQRNSTRYLSTTKPLFVNIIFCSRRFSACTDASFVFSEQWEDCTGLALLSKQRIVRFQIQTKGIITINIDIPSRLPPSFGRSRQATCDEVTQSWIIWSCMYYVLCRRNFELFFDCWELINIPRFDIEDVWYLNF